jgi:hypothetical protein
LIPSFSSSKRNLPICPLDTLGDIITSKLDPAVMAEVIDGLKTVGLTSEARELASEVILGLSREEK